MIIPQDRILIIAPHPDDECIGAGGILSKYGELCEVIVLSDGRIGQNDMSPEQTRKMRREEFEKEMELLSIAKYSMLDYEDSKLCLFSDILRDIDLRQYTKVFVTGDSDGNIDHTSAYKCVIDEAKKLIKCPQIYKYEVHEHLKSPTHFLDITDVIEEKKKLIECHKSQLKYVSYDEMAYSLNKYRACQLRLKDAYAEVFEAVEITADQTQTVSKSDRELAKFKQFYSVLTNWMKKNTRGECMEDTLINLGYKSVVVYGFAELGQLLTEEILKDGRLKLLYVLDQKSIKNDGVRVMSPTESLEKPDCVIVSAVYSFDEIVRVLKEYGYKNIISLSELL